MHVSERPALRNPVLLVGFSGWVDGGEVATRALRFLIDSWGAKKFAELDPEPFYNFSRARPQVHLGPDATRFLTWPETSLYYHADPRLDRDVVLLLGIEPNFKWRTFCEEVLEVCRSVGIASALTLGGVLAEVAHTSPAQITVFSSDPELCARFPELGGRRGGYQGPTGIIGVLADGLTRMDIPVGTMRGAVPHYLGAWPNPKVRHALLARLGELYGWSLDLTRLEAASQRFERRVNRSLRERPELAAYVKRLEGRREDSEPTGESAERAASPEETPEAPGGEAPSGELPSGEEIVRELERFFWGRATGQDDEPQPGPQRS
jgi:proteasome assembly chaperone (PAC2) family protein